MQSRIEVTTPYANPCANLADVSSALRINGAREQLATRPASPRELATRPTTASPKKQPARPPTPATASHWPASAHVDAPRSCPVRPPVCAAETRHAWDDLVITNEATSLLVDPASASAPAMRPRVRAPHPPADVDASSLNASPQVSPRKLRRHLVPAACEAGSPVMLRPPQVQVGGIASPVGGAAITLPPNVITHNSIIVGATWLPRIESPRKSHDGASDASSDSPAERFLRRVAQA
jgi:hypothetical protein